MVMCTWCNPCEKHVTVGRGYQLRLRMRHAWATYSLHRFWPKSESVSELQLLLARLMRGKPATQF